MNDRSSGEAACITTATQAGRARRLRQLHRGDDPLILVNAWDVASARALASVEGCQAIATASAAVAAANGYPDDERIPVDVMLAVVGQIARAVELPVTADLEAGYGDPGGVVRAALRAGVVGVNIEDQMRPLDEASDVIRSAVTAGRDEGVPLVVNARTDAWLKSPSGALREAFARGEAYLDAGADCFFIPWAPLADVTHVVDALGQGRVSAMWVPGGPTPRQLVDAGVCRVSFGPFGQAAAMRALQRAAAEALAGSALW